MDRFFWVLSTSTQPTIIPQQQHEQQSQQEQKQKESLSISRGN